ncbi:MAG: hypothetical protein AAF492_07620 [Verrucomicrobiota bacterium]
MNGTPLSDSEQSFYADPAPPAFELIAQSIPLWDASADLRPLMDSIGDPARDPGLRFLLGIELFELGHEILKPLLFELIHVETPASWFRPKDWQRMLGAGIKEKELALALAAAPAPHAYMMAVRFILENMNGEPEALAALKAFLRAGSQRMTELRVRAAGYLHQRGNYVGYPLLLGSIEGGKRGDEEEDLNLAVDLFAHVPGDLVAAGTRAMLIAGKRVVGEHILIHQLQRPGVEAKAREEAWMDVLECASDSSTRQAVVEQVKWGGERSRKLQRLAEVFAWGVTMGRELSGRIFNIKMHGGRSLGYTRMNENKIYISPLPMVREEKFGRDIVEGLILHEIGHHLYHRGKVE